MSSTLVVTNTTMPTPIAVSRDTNDYCAVA
jgi:hypothetical protein